MKALNPDQGISTQVEDLPQSDNFQWQTVPASLSGTNSESCIGLSDQSPDIAQKQPEADIQRVSQAHRPSELLINSQQIGKGVLVKEEHIEDYEKKDFAETSSSSSLKRKTTTVRK